MNMQDVFVTPGNGKEPASQSQVGSSNQSITSHDSPSDILEKRYKAILGEKNQEYYLKRFQEFDKKGSKFQVSGNFWAWYFNAGWFLYRKMYGLFFAYILFSIVVSVPMRIVAEIFMEKSQWGLLITILIIGLFLTILLLLYSNSLYHKHILKKISKAQHFITNEPELLAYLRAKGGVHSWCLWVAWASLSLPVIGVVAAIIIPQFAAYSSKKAGSQQTPFSSVAEKPIAQKTLTDEEFFGKKQATTQQNPFDQFDKKTATEQPPQNNTVPDADQEKITNEHFNTIRRAVPDFDQIVASGELRAWIDTQASPIREQYRKVADAGTATEVIDLLNRYKNNQNDIKNAIQQRSSRMKQFYEAQDFYAVIREAESGQYLSDHSNMLGVSLFKTNQISRAVTAFQTAEKALPNSANIKCNLGDAYLSSGSLSKALAKYCEALNIEPTNEAYKQRISSIENRSDFASYGYSSKRVSVDFFKMDIHNVFRLFREIAGIKINVDSSVQGTLTLNLKNIPWDLALDVVLNMSNLTRRNYSDSINIY